MKKAVWTSILKLILFSILFFLFIYIGVRIVDYSKKAVTEISEKFNSEKVVNEFYSYVESIEGSNKLHVATIKTVDRFSKKDSQSILWDLISLPDVVIELHIPVEYNYYVDLKGKWDFSWEESDSTIFVIAPEINYFTPAVNVSKMEIIEKESSMLRDSEQVKEKLRKELSEKLLYVAERKKHLIRDVARKEIKQFLHSWFYNKYFKSNSNKQSKLKVIFKDEISSEDNNQKYFLNKQNEISN